MALGNVAGVAAQELPPEIPASLDTVAGADNRIKNQVNPGILRQDDPVTDLRLRFSRAPFDHPMIKVFNGHPGNQNAITATQPGLGTNLGADDTFTVFATGRFGGGNLVPFAPAP